MGMREGSGEGGGQAWGGNVSGDPSHIESSHEDQTGVAGASLAGTPAGPARAKKRRSGTDNAEAETSGLKPPVGDPSGGQTRQSTDAEPPRGPGEFTEDATPPPAYDE